MTTPMWLALVAVLLPGVLSLLLAIAAPLRKAGKPAAFVMVTGALAAFVSATWLLIDRLNGAADVRETVPWLIASGKSVAELGVLLDGVSIPMLFIVTLVAAAVQVFSLGYMGHEPPAAFGRYFTLHGLFLTAMNVLVVAPNLLQLFVGWELVGLASYLLIGFYFEKPSAAKAAVKAFWMTKLGDVGFLFALLVLFVANGNFEWTNVPTTAIATLVTALLFFAVMGKSAQFPLHVWLPDAMEGPTPVSALLHAATMVAAGVFLVVRVDPLFAAAPLTRDVMVWVGAVTAIFAALLALVQEDIKKVLAFSTVSQLGYMVAALGAGSAFAGFFHLGTHAFFKALLFLAAGSAIHAVHSNQLKDMGGLRKAMPITSTAFILGALSLSGVPGFAGFFSKDLVLTTLEGRAGWVPWSMLIGSAFLTALYMGRTALRAFFGEASEHAKSAPESGLSMTGPLLVLVVPTVLAGFLGGSLARLTGAEYHPHLGLTPVMASVAAIAGLVTSYVLFVRGQAVPFSGVVAAFDRFGAVDFTWLALYKWGLGSLSALSAWIDRYIVDGVINALGYAVLELGEKLRAIQTGRIRDYAVAVALGALVLIALGGWR